jgi:hypothetical protein
MRHETAVRRLRTIADRCEQARGLWDERLLLGAYAFGTVLHSRSDLDVVQVAFVLDLPPDDLTWQALPPSCVGLARLLDLDKTPVEWHLRPAVWPVSNHVIRRPLRIWSTDGPDVAALDALGRGDAEPLRLPEPDDATAREQLAAELAASLAHLRRVEQRYWEPDWRREHRGSGLHPEDHLWRAVHGHLDLLAADRELRGHAA